MIGKRRTTHSHIHWYDKEYIRAEGSVVRTCSAQQPPVRLWWQEQPERLVTLYAAVCTPTPVLSVYQGAVGVQTAVRWLAALSAQHHVEYAARRALSCTALGRQPSASHHRLCMYIYSVCVCVSESERERRRTRLVSSS